MKELKKTKENKGITLIALVITIIVLLILAGVTIATLTGENGILTRASKAREENKIAQAQEEVDLAFQTLRIKEKAESVTKEQKDDIVLEELKGAYSKQKPESTVNLTGTRFYVKHRGYDFQVDENYQVAFKGETFDEKEWAKKEADEDCFIWASDDENAGEAYHTIIGYSDKITSLEKLVIPTRCHVIRSEEWYYQSNGREFAQRTFKEVKIPSTVTTIGNNAFRYFPMESIEIPNSVTTIENEAFYNCYSLSDVIIPDSVTNIGWGAFSGTPWYEFQPDGLIYIGKVAYKYKGEMPYNTSITIKEGTKALADDLFNYQRNLTSVEIPEGVTTIGRYAFYECSGLTSINIPDSVTSIGERAFAYCYNLSNITMANVASVGADAFYETAWINNKTGLLYIGTTLYGYNGHMPDNTSIVVEPGTTEIAGGAFSGYTGLVSIEIPDSVTSIGGSAFYNCSNLRSIDIPNGVTTISSWLFENCTSLASVEIPDSVTKIQYGAFYNCTNLERADIPDSVTIMEWGIFNNCTSLSSVNIPNGVTRIEGNTFYNCTSLTSIEIPNGVTSIEGNAFENCTNLANIEMPDSAIFVSNYAFNRTAWYDNQPDGLIYIGKVAYAYKGTMPANTTISIREGTKAISGYLFDNQSNLVSVEIPDSLIGIGDYAFSDCTNLTSISISRNTEYIGYYAFESCTNLSSIVIWRNVGEVRDRSFRGWGSNQTINVEIDEVPSGWHWLWNYECDAQIVYAYSD